MTDNPPPASTTPPAQAPEPAPNPGGGGGGGGAPFDPWAKTIVVVFTIGGAILYALLVVHLGWDAWGAKKTPKTDEVQSAVVVGIGLVFGPALTAWLGLTVDKFTITGRSAVGWLGRVLGSIAGGLSSIRIVARLGMMIYLLAGGFAGLTYLVNHDVTPKVILGIAAGWAAQGSAIIAVGLKRGFGG